MDRAIIASARIALRRLDEPGAYVTGRFLEASGRLC